MLLHSSIQRSHGTALARNSAAPAPWGIVAPVYGPKSQHLMRRRNFTIRDIRSRQPRAHFIYCCRRVTCPNSK